MATHILVVDDETAIADLVEVYLKNEGFTIHKFYNASDALACVRTTRLNLAVLDVMLPDMDGFTLCQRIREDHLFPIIMLTAKVEDMDKIMGLTLGADDYITKPFNILELKARIRAMLRRAGASGQKDKASRVQQGHIVLDTDERSAWRDGVPVELTAKEFDLMELLMRNPRQLIPTERFLERIWGYDSEVEVSVVWVYISYLRKKLAALQADVEIRASRNLGYALEVRA